MLKLILKSISKILGYSIIHPRKAKIVYGSIIKGISKILLYSLFNSKEVKIGIKKLREKDEDFKVLDISYKEIPKEIDIPSNNKYLKNSKYIQRDADKIVELSNSLMKISIDKEDYIKKVFDFVQNKISFGINSDESALGTLMEGQAFCYGKMNLMAALLRRQEIEARFKIVPIIIENKIVNFVGNDMNNNSQDLLLRLVNNLVPHAILEVKLNNEWIEADPVIPINLCGYLKYPIIKFGDHSLWIKEESSDVVYLQKFHFSLLIC